MAGAGAGVARAHIGPAAVKAILSMEGGRPTLLWLNEGLAIRRGDTWHYVCPALWGDAQMGDADSVQSGTAWVGAQSGVWLFQADGSVAPHPDPVAAGGIPLALSASQDSVMQLRQEGDVTRLLRLDLQKAEVVWSDLTRWDTMAVGDDFVVVLRMPTAEIETVRLATDGTELARESVMPPPSSLGPIGRIVGSSLYVTVSRLLPDTSYGVEAARIESGAWHSLHVGVGFVGPTPGPGGELIVAVDGQLAALDGDTTRPLPLDTLVNCVDEFQGFVYACDSVGLREITADGPGPALFELQKLEAPEQDLVPADKRELCSQQWDLYQGDLAWVGSLAGNADAGVPDGGVRAPDAGAGAMNAPDGGGAAMGGAQGGVLPPAPLPMTARDSGGCAIGAPASGRWPGPLALVFAAILRRAALRRRQR